MWCQSPRRQTKISVPINIDNLRLNPDIEVKYLGVLIDSHLTFAANASHAASSCFAMLRRIRSVRGSVPRPLLVTLTESLVLSRLDYCISVHTGLPASTIWRLQRVLNAAARLVFRAGRYDHVTPLLAELEWLPVRQRIDMRLGTLAYQCQRGMAPPYLSNELVTVSSLSGRQHLRSSKRGLLSVPLVRRKTFGGRAFSTAASRLWNRLPESVMSAADVSSFKKLFKSFLCDCKSA